MSLSSAESNADGNADDNADDIDNGIPMNNIAVIEDFKEQSTEEHMLHHPVNPRSLVQCRTTVNEEHYNIFPFHCLPYTDLRPEACCFHGCVIDIWGLQSSTKRKEFIDDCWYTSKHPLLFPVPKKRQCYGFEVADTKLIFCSNNQCSMVNGNSNDGPSLFHYSCYAKMVEEEELEHLFYIDTDDFFTDEQKEGINVLMNIVEYSRVLLPVCGKKCYNTIISKRKAQLERDNEEREYLLNINNSNDSNSLLHWDCDAVNGARSSEEIIVDWLSDEVNAKMYFGADDSFMNPVYGTRKESYHKHLSQKILSENGEIVLCKLY